MTHDLGSGFSVCLGLRVGGRRQWRALCAGSSAVISRPPEAAISEHTAGGGTERCRRSQVAAVSCARRATQLVMQYCALATNDDDDSFTYPLTLCLSLLFDARSPGRARTRRQTEGRLYGGKAADWLRWLVGCGSTSCGRPAGWSFARRQLGLPISCAWRFDRGDVQFGGAVIVLVDSLQPNALGAGADISPYATDNTDSRQ